MPTSKNTASSNLQQNGSSDRWPKDVGILAIDIYFPSTYVEQTDLEAFNGVSAGKYTIGLGQTRMAFCNDREDIASLCLTVTERLLNKYNISPKDIGFLEIGTETIIDKSKSVKTVLMDLFKDSGNFSIEGVHSTNACYGGTASLFHAVDWIEGSNWDGRYALVVAADIAVYASGPARPTGGCGAVAMLIGPNSAIVLDRGVRSTYMANVYDFYKPDLNSEYPYVDGPLSNQCYLQALDQCYNVYFDKVNRLHEKCCETQGNTGSKMNIELQHYDAILFHAPYCKLVQKSVARLHLLNSVRTKGLDGPLQKYSDIKLEDSYNDRDLEKILLVESKELFVKRTDPSLHLAREIGNMYTASLYACLISYIMSDSIENLAQKRLLLFSYGSGLAASMFSARITKDTSPESALTKIVNVLRDVPKRLAARRVVPAAQFEETLNLREKTHNLAPYTPTGDVTKLFNETYYLTGVNDKHHRVYEKTA